MTLEQRAVACARWRWVEGMLAVKHGLRSRVSAEYRGHLHQPAAVTAWRSDSVPDLADPATLGCLLALVREAHGGVGSVVYLPRDGAIRLWRVVTYAHGAEWLTPSRLLGEGATEAEALVAALEAAP